jgi:hypothetical protein
MKTINTIIIAIYIIAMTILTSCLYADDLIKINHLATKIVDNAELGTVDTNNKIFKLLFAVNDSITEPNKLDKLVKSGVYDTVSVNKIALKSLIEANNQKQKKHDATEFRESVEAISNIISTIKSYCESEEFSNFEVARLLYQISQIQEQYSNPAYLLDDDGKMVAVNKTVFESMVRAVDYDKAAKIESVGTILKQNNIVAGSVFDYNYYFKQLETYINQQFNTVNYIVILSILVVILILSKMFRVVDVVLRAIIKITIASVKAVYLLLKMVLLVVKYSVYLLNKALNKKQ